MYQEIPQGVYSNLLNLHIEAEVLSRNVFVLFCFVSAFVLVFVLSFKSYFHVDLAKPFRYTMYIYGYFLAVHFIHTVL